MMDVTIRCEFQFPSNGKGFPNEDVTLKSKELFLILVSIPFKRERLSEHAIKLELQESAYKFSIPFKRERLSETSIYFSNIRLGNIGFNSLQTGKAFRTAPLPNPVTVRAKLAKTKRDDF